jgi:hypothetical protein
MYFELKVHSFWARLFRKGFSLHKIDGVALPHVQNLSKVLERGSLPANICTRVPGKSYLFCFRSHVAKKLVEGTSTFTCPY